MTLWHLLIFGLFDQRLGYYKPTELCPISSLWKAGREHGLFFIHYNRKHNFPQFSRFAIPNIQAFWGPSLEIPCNGREERGKKCAPILMVHLSFPFSPQGTLGTGDCLYMVDCRTIILLGAAFWTESQKKLLYQNSHNPISKRRQQTSKRDNQTINPSRVLTLALTLHNFMILNQSLKETEDERSL